MKNKIIKIFSLLLVFAMVFTFAGCSSDGTVELSPAELAIQNDALVKPAQNADFMYNVFETYVNIVKYIGKGKADVKIPETLEDRPVYVLTEGAFADNEEIKSVEIPETIVQYGNNLFSGCINLESIKFPSTMTAIPDGTCSGCESLVSFNLPEGLVSIGNDAFRGCALAKKLVLPKRVETIGDSAFAYCQNIEEIVILDGDIVDENGVYVTTYEKTVGMGAFSDLPNIKKVVIPDTVVAVDFRGFTANEDTMFYGYTYSVAASMCSENQFFFTEIKEGDEIDIVIKQRPTVIED